MFRPIAVSLFTHPLLQTYAFDQVPEGEELYLMGEEWMTDYDAAFTAMADGGPYANVGYISPAVARRVGPDSIELSWYPNTHERFHEVKITLPKDQFRACVGSYEWDMKPRIFVDRDWLENLHLRAYSVFAMVDAIGVKGALERGELSRVKLIELRDRIDALASANPTIAFISFADSLLLKSNWSVGYFARGIKYDYAPELFIHVIAELKQIYLAALGLEIYAVLTQGSNEYYEDGLIHISASRNHISLNSLGLPFSQIQSIESSARRAIKSGGHAPAEVYMDYNFYNSLNWKYEFKKGEQPRAPYVNPMASGESHYFYNVCETIIENLK